MQIRVEKKSELVLVFSSLLLIVLTLVCSYVIGTYDVKELAIFLGAVIIIVMLSVYCALRFSATKHDELADTMVEKMRGVIELAECRVVIDNKLLGYVEKEAKTIWVVSKTLENDVSDEDIAQTVLENLQSGEKRYYYFIPDPDREPTVRRNKRAYEERYKDYLDRVTFKVLPENTLFMFDEVVIYEPEEKEPFGYTYIDLEGSGKRDQVVRIARENVNAIINTLSRLIDPVQERRERLMRMVMGLAGEVAMGQRHTALLVSAIIQGEITIEQQRECEEGLRADGLNDGEVERVSKVLSKIRYELQGS